MKSFRILLVYKYLTNHTKKWNGILKYWYSANINSISNQRWDNTVPHVQAMDDIPLFFRKCLIEFKDYYSKHGTNINDTISSKIIYANLIRDINHTPTSIIRYPEMINYFAQLGSYHFLDPYLRQFLYKLYHCRLYFKRYRLNINDMLNFGQRCLLCNSAIDTPKHLFVSCEAGSQLREKRDTLIRIYNTNNTTLNENEKIYSLFPQTNYEIMVIQYIVTLSNYSIFRIKMKKYFDREYIVCNTDPFYFFLEKLKSRIIIDHKRLKIRKFKEYWDPNNNYEIMYYNENKILQWYL